VGEGTYVLGMGQIKTSSAFAYLYPYPVRTTIAIPITMRSIVAVERRTSAAQAPHKRRTTGRFWACLGDTAAPILRRKRASPGPCGARRHAP